MLIGIIVYGYLNYPGVRDQFIQHEMSLLTPEQRAAMEQVQKANAAAARRDGGSVDAARGARSRPPRPSRPAAPPPASPPPAAPSA